MGWHSGLVVANTSWSALEAVLGPKIRAQPSRMLVAIDDAERDDCVGGELDGRAYLSDGLMMISTNGDLIVELSRELGCLVIGCGAETVSGSFWLFAADHGKRLRIYWACAMELDAALDSGAWARSIKLEDLDASGMRDALASEGFDFDAWCERGTKRILDLPEDSDLGAGSIADEIDAFRETHRIPAGQQPQPRVVLRGSGFDVGTVKSAQLGFWSRVRGWFSRN
jgi:hypothetical protein